MSNGELAYTQDLSAVAKGEPTAIPIECPYPLVEAVIHWGGGRAEFSADGGRTFRLPGRHSGSPGVIPVAGASFWLETRAGRVDVSGDLRVKNARQ